MEQGTFDDTGTGHLVPVKLCECGCSMPAPIATHTSTKHGYVKGQPTRFIRGHSTGKVARRARRVLPEIMQLVRLCECGCGKPTPVAKRTERKRGYIKGQPVRFAPGHNRMLGAAREAAKVPPPAKVCE